MRRRPKPDFAFENGLASMHKATHAPSHIIVNAMTRGGSPCTQKHKDTYQTQLSVPRTENVGVRTNSSTTTRFRNTKWNVMVGRNSREQYPTQLPWPYTTLSAPHA